MPTAAFDHLQTATDALELARKHIGLARAAYPDKAADATFAALVSHATITHAEAIALRIIAAAWRDDATMPAKRARMAADARKGTK